MILEKIKGQLSLLLVIHMHIFSVSFLNTMELIIQKETQSIEERETSMTRHPFILILLMMLAVILASCGSTNTSPPSSSTSSFTCTFKQFSANVHQGPDRGLSVQGQLTLQVNQAGSLTGTLKQTNGQNVSVVGQANGRAINLVFDLGQSRLLFGVGTLQQDIHTCTGAVGGPLVGPRGGDSGNWGTPSKPGMGGGGG